MTVYELRHTFFRHKDEIVGSVSDLGLYSTIEQAENAIQYYVTQPGFKDNQDAFSVRERPVTGECNDGIVYEAMVYFHSEDYEFEYTAELGLYGDEEAANEKMKKHCADNQRIINAKDVIVEKLVNECILDQRTWAEGFDIYTY